MNQGQADVQPGGVSPRAGGGEEDAAVEAVPLPGGAHALFTARAQGNLSLAAGLGREHGRVVRDRLCAALRLRWLCAGPQVHGTHVRRVLKQTHSGGEPVSEPADGHATALAGVGVMVLAADCVPVVLGMRGAVAAVHAGWRGLAAGVLEEGVRALRELGEDDDETGDGDGGETGDGYGHGGETGDRRGEAEGAPDAANPGDRPPPAPRADRPDAEIVAVIGPCAGPCCYEVGEEVLTALGVPAPAPAPASAMLDLRAIASERLLRAGVREVLHVERCTICDEGLFSHRREGAAAGRQAAIAWRA